MSAPAGRSGLSSVIYSLAGFALLALTFYVFRLPPFRSPKCPQSIFIDVDDATGLKNRSAVKAMGVSVGYIQRITIQEDHARVGICITAPVTILPSTRAYLREEGFLGDKVLEIKPVQYKAASQ